MLLILPSSVLQQIVNYLDTNSYLAIELTSTAFSYVTLSFPSTLIVASHVSCPKSHTYNYISSFFSFHLPYFQSILYPSSPCPSSSLLPSPFSLLPPSFSLLSSSKALFQTFCIQVLGSNCVLRN